LILAEGYMDVITAHQKGVNHAVGALGTALTTEQARLLMRFTYNTAICFDSDTAGQEAALRGMEILQQLGCKVSIVTVPAGKDPDEYLKKAGTEGFLSWLRKLRPFLNINWTNYGRNMIPVQSRGVCR
jgi:DNA primase